MKIKQFFKRKGEKWFFLIIDIKKVEIISFQMKVNEAFLYNISARQFPELKSFLLKWDISLSGKDHTLKVRLNKFLLDYNITYANIPVK